MSKHVLLKQVIKWVLLTYIVAQVLFVIAFAFYPPVGAAALILLGRGPDCPRSEAYQAVVRQWRNHDNQKELVAVSRLVRQDDDGFQLMTTPWGEFWEPVVGGSAVLAQIAEMKAKYDTFPIRPVRPGDIALDCGANVGVSGRQMLDLGAKLVVLIEPAPKNVESLRRNLATEIEEGRAIVYPKGVWDKDDTLVLYENTETTAMDSVVIHNAAERGIKVPLTTIDKIVAELGLERVDFIKMDIEGAEKQALTGAARTLRKYKPRMEISVNHLPDDPEKIPALITEIEPSYRGECLLCVGDWSQWRIESNILFFQSATQLAQLSQ